MCPTRGRRSPPVHAVCHGHRGQAVAGGHHLQVGSGDWDVCGRDAQFASSSINASYCILVETSRALYLLNFRQCLVECSENFARKYTSLSSLVSSIHVTSKHLLPLFMISGFNLRTPVSSSRSESLFKISLSIFCTKKCIL